MTKPYYDQDGIVIWNCDCRDILPTIPQGSIDLVLTDPPYGVNWQSGHRQQSFALMIGDDSITAAQEGIRLALPSLRRGRHVYIFGRYDLSALPLKSITELIWDKVNHNSGDLSLPWGNQHEYIQFAVHDISEVGRASHQNPSRLRKGTVLHFLRPNADAVQYHPSEKPIPLLRELIESSSRIGETVLDPFLGSGSTIEACKLEGRKAIGIEIEERYCEIAANRLRQTVMRLEPRAPELSDGPMMAGMEE